MKKADYIIKSKAVFYGFPKPPCRGCIAVKDNLIIYAGNDESIVRQCTDAGTKVIDAGSHLVMPGFHDAHLHFYMSGLYDSSLVNVSFTDTSEQECVEGLAEIAERIPKDRWLIGAGWYHPSWDHPVLPTKKSLDMVYPDRPVCMVSADAHAMWFNSEGLKKVGLDNNIKDPQGGHYGRFPDGTLSGTVHEIAAMALFPQIFSFTEEEENEFYRKFIHKLNSYGITSVCDMAMTAVPGVDFIREDIYQRLLLNNELSVRVNLYPTLENNLSRPLKMREYMTGEILRCQGVKQFADGVSADHTAYLKKDYANAKFSGDHGKMTIPEEDMRKMILNAHKNNVSIRIHAVGDQAIHILLNIFEEAEQKYGQKTYLHHTLEHLENFQPDDIERMAKLHIQPSVQPEHILIDPEGVERDLGPERIKDMWPFRRLIDSGSVLAFGTDSPDADINPFYGLYNAVTRQSVHTKEPKGGWMPSEKITLEEALSAYTYGSACASGREQKIGLLEAGKFADIIILDSNPFEEGVERLLDTSVTMTIMNGQIIYTK